MGVRHVSIRWHRPGRQFCNPAAAVSRVISSFAVSARAVSVSVSVSVVSVSVIYARVIYARVICRHGEHERQRLCAGVGPGRLICAGRRGLLQRR